MCAVVVPCCHVEVDEIPDAVMIPTCRPLVGNTEIKMRLTTEEPRLPEGHLPLFGSFEFSTTKLLASRGPTEELACVSINALLSFWKLSKTSDITLQG